METLFECRLCNSTDNVGASGLCSGCQAMHDVMDEAHALIEAEEGEDDAL